MSALEPVPFTRRKEPQPRLSKPRVPGKRNERFWTEEEKQILRDFYPTEGASACFARMPRFKHIGRIFAMANSLGLRTSKMTTERKRHEFTPELDETIRTEWALLEAKKGAVQELADKLGIDRWVLSKRAAKLGLTIPHKKEPLWTQAENDLLARVPLHDPAKCARIFKDHGFHRTPTSIVVHSTRMGLSRRCIDGFSACKAAAILGVDSKWVTGRIIDGSLLAKRRGTQRLVQQGGDTWLIKPEHLRKFVIDHLEQIDLRKVEKFAFVALIAGDSMEAK